MSDGLAMRAMSALFLGALLVACGGSMADDIPPIGSEQGAGASNGSRAGADGSGATTGSGAVGDGRGGGAPPGGYPKYGGASSCVPALTWKWDGGRSPTYDESRIRDCRTYEWKQYDRNQKMKAYCSTTLGTSRITTADIHAALNHGDVAAAFRGSASIYGRDTRPVDGALLQITLQNRSIHVGEACGSTSACTPIPPGLSALRNLLLALDQQETANPARDCD